MSLLEEQRVFVVDEDAAMRDSIPVPHGSRCARDAECADQSGADQCYAKRDGMLADLMGPNLASKAIVLCCAHLAQACIRGLFLNRDM